ncbi:MAG: hypothetical protein JW969_15625 [Spirochaetales bacterium]|nr:hypothetical protein [Spirochaetales bacterium]
MTGAPAWAFISSCLYLPAASSYLALNFTGATTYTSLSGVVKEMSYAVPAIIILVLSGVVIRVIGFFV